MDDWLPVYAAGFFDGEGSIAIRRNPPQSKNSTSPLPRYRLEVVVRITERQAIDKLAERWGGYIIFSKSPNDKWKDWWQWNIHSLKAKHFLEDILPYLIIKRERAELAIQFQQHLIDNAGLRFKGQGMKRLPLEETMQIRDSFFEEMKRLNMRGRQPTY